jgi:hypothetical protein
MNAVFWNIKPQFVLTGNTLRFHGADYEECHFLEYDAAWFL